MILTKNNGVWTDAEDGNFKIKIEDSWVDVQEGLVKVGGVWKQFYPKPSAVLSDTTYYIPKPTENEYYTYTIPERVYNITVSAVGGGGAQGSYHDSGYTTYVFPGGVGGGGVVDLAVNPGDILKIYVGKGGGVASNWGVGSSATDTKVYYNNSLLLTASKGGSAGTQSLGTNGTFTNDLGTLISTSTATLGSSQGADDNYIDSTSIDRFNIWSFVDYDDTTFPESKGGAITQKPDYHFTNWNRAGLTSYDGWVSISF